MTPNKLWLCFWHVHIYVCMNSHQGLFPLGSYTLSIMAGPIFLLSRNPPPHKHGCYNMFRCLLEILCWRWRGLYNVLVCCAVCLVSHVGLFVTPWTAAHQGPLSMGILQARILECVAFSRGSSQSRDWTQVSRIAGILYHLSPREASAAITE